MNILIDLEQLEKVRSYGILDVQSKKNIVRQEAGIIH